MLVTMKEILDHANQHNYAVIAPNVFYEQDVRACLKMAEELQAPVILDVIHTLVEDTVTQGWYFRQLAEQSCVPVAINLDHGANFSHAIAAIRAGFTSIMVDRSSLPYAENVAQVKELVRIAHSVGVSVEAELGHVGQASDSADAWASGLTDPAQAKSFVDETGVDCLAVAIGTAHGLYSGVPTLHFELLAEIKEAVKLPLVLHGGSGSGDENIRKACTMGINKVNLCSEMLAGICAAVVASVAAGDPPHVIYQVMEKGLVARLKDYMELSGSVGKAWTKENKTGVTMRICAYDEESAVEQAL